MKKRELSQAAMANVLVNFLENQQDAIAASKIAAQEAQDVVAAYRLIHPRLGGTARRTQEITKLRRGLKNTFLDVLVAVLGPVRSYAARQSDTELLALATVGKVGLRRMRPQALVAVGQKLVETCEGLAASLQDYAVDAATLQALRTAYDAFVASVPQTRLVITERSVDNLTARELLRALMQQIYELDAAMEIFALRDKVLYAAYKSARQIIDVGGRTRTDAPAA